MAGIASTIGNRRRLDMYYYAKKVFEIPVYSCSKDAYARYCRRRLEAYFKLANQAAVQDAKVWQMPITADRIKRDMTNWEDANIYPWEYNQCVGFIRLFVSRRHVGADLFLPTKRISKTMLRKCMRLAGNLFDDVIYDDLSSQQICTLILDKLHYTSKLWLSKNRHIDLSTFTMLAPFVEWRELLLSP
jgi:hypothetical protein